MPVKENNNNKCFWKNHLHHYQHDVYRLLRGFNCLSSSSFRFSLFLSRSRSILMDRLHDPTWLKTYKVWSELIEDLSNYRVYRQNVKNITSLVVVKMSRGFSNLSSSAVYNIIKRLSVWWHHQKLILAACDLRALRQCGLKTDMILSLKSLYGLRNISETTMCEHRSPWWPQIQVKALSEEATRERDPGMLPSSLCQSSAKWKTVLLSDE